MHASSMHIVSAESPSWGSGQCGWLRLDLLQRSLYVLVLLR